MRSLIVEEDNPNAESLTWLAQARELKELNVPPIWEEDESSPKVLDKTLLHTPAHLVTESLFAEIVLDFVESQGEVTLQALRENANLHTAASRTLHCVVRILTEPIATV